MTLAVILILVCWSVFALYWIVSSFSQKQSTEKPRNIIALILTSVAFMILIEPDLFHLNILIVKNSLLIYTGVGVCALGMIICLWARKILAGNWSNSIDLKKDHELIKKGPYGIVRHPIYSGFLLMFLGSILAIGKLGVLIGFVILFISCLLRIKQEEDLMTKYFKKEYLEYKKQVRAALVPYLL